MIEYGSASWGRKPRAIREAMVNNETIFSSNIIDAARVSRVAVKQSNCLDRRNGIAFVKYVILKAFNGILTFNIDKMSIAIIISDIMGNGNPTSSLLMGYFFILTIFLMQNHRKKFLYMNMHLGYIVKTVGGYVVE